MEYTENAFRKISHEWVYNKTVFPSGLFLLLTAALKKNEILYTLLSYCSEGATKFFTLPLLFEGWLPLTTGEPLPKLQVPKISASIVSGSHGVL